MIEKKNAKKKVLIALTSSDFGGAPQVVFDLLSHVKDTSFEFCVAAPSGGIFVEKFKNLGYTVYEVPLDVIDWKSLWGLYKASQKEKVSLINSHGKGAGLYARLIGLVLRIPVIQTFHGIHYNYRNRFLRFFYILLERILTRFTRLVINVSPSQEDEGLRLGIFPKRKSRVVLNGLDIKAVGRVKVERDVLRKQIGLTPDAFVAVFVARFDPVKGHERLIRILPDLLEAMPKLKFVFVGDGELKGNMENLVNELGVSSSTRFLGYRSDVLEVLKSSDVFVSPALHEGLPLAVLEAGACGLPVVADDVVGVRDAVINGRTGFLVNFSIDHVKESLLELYLKPKLQEQMGNEGRKLVSSRFSIKNFVQQTLMVYAEVAK